MLENHLRVVPDFPKEGIQFLDISPILETPNLFAELISQMEEAVKGWDFNKIAAIESRGFVLGAGRRLYN